MHWGLLQASHQKFEIPSTLGEAHGAVFLYTSGTYGKNQTKTSTFLVHKQRRTRAKIGTLESMARTKLKLYNYWYTIKGQQGQKLRQ